MAVFISRMLAHTHARPAGLIIQAAEPGLSPQGIPTSPCRSPTGTATIYPGQARLVDVFISYEPRRWRSTMTGRCTSHVSSACRVRTGLRGG